MLGFLGISSDSNELSGEEDWLLESLCMLPAGGGEESDNFLSEPKKLFE